MKNKRGLLLIRTGILLIVCAGLLTSWNLYDDYRAGKRSQSSAEYLKMQVIPAPTPSSQASNPSPDAAQQPVLPQQMQAIDVPRDPSEIEIPDYILNPDMKMPTARYDGQDYIGVLEIPAIDLKISVIDEWTYPRLRIAPCRYTGSIYKDNMVIAAHNYNSHFGRLDDLHEGDYVFFTDLDGNLFRYRIALCETLMPTDVAEMTDGQWDLSLFTCTIGGSYRVTVRCERV